MKRLFSFLMFIILISMIGFAAPEDPVITAPLAFNDFPAGNIVVDGTCNSGNTDDIAISGDAPATTVPCDADAWTYTWVLPDDTETANYDLTFTSTKDVDSSNPVTNTFDVDTKDPEIFTDFDSATVCGAPKITIEFTTTDIFAGAWADTFNPDPVPNWTCTQGPANTYTCEFATPFVNLPNGLVLYQIDLQDQGGNSATPKTGQFTYAKECAETTKTLAVTSTGGISVSKQPGSAVFDVTFETRDDGTPVVPGVGPTKSLNASTGWCNNNIVANGGDGKYKISCQVPADATIGHFQDLKLDATIAGEAKTATVRLTVASNVQFERVAPATTSMTAKKGDVYLFKVKLKEGTSYLTDKTVTIGGTEGCTGTMIFTGTGSSGSYQANCTLNTIGNKTVTFSSTYGSVTTMSTDIEVTGNTTTTDGLVLSFTRPSSVDSIVAGNVLLFITTVKDGAFGVTGATVEITTPSGKKAMEDLDNGQYKLAYVLPSTFSSYTFSITATKDSKTGTATKAISLADVEYDVTLSAPLAIYEIGDKVKFTAEVKMGTSYVEDASISAKVNGKTIDFEETDTGGEYISDEYEIVAKDGVLKKLKLEATASKTGGSGSAELEVALQVEDLETDLEENMTLVGNLLKFRVTDKDGNKIENGTFTVTFDGITYDAEYISDNLYQATIEVSDENKTSYTVKLSGYDEAGNSLQETLTVSYQQGGEINWLLIALVFIAIGCVGVFYFLFTKLPPSSGEVVGDKLQQLQKKRRDLINADKSAHYKFYKKMIDEPTLNTEVEKYKRQLRSIDEQIKKIKGK